MLDEIMTENEVVTIIDVKEWLDINFYKTGLRNVECYDLTLCTRYVNFTLCKTLDFRKSSEMRADVGTLELEAGIRRSGNMDLEEMKCASDEIRAAIAVVERFNDQFGGVSVMFNNPEALAI